MKKTPIHKHRVVNKTNVLLLVFTIISVRCTQKVATSDFHSFLQEPCMLLNYEQDNTIEGKYLRAKKSNEKILTVQIDIPKNFYIDTINCSQWLIGWGSHQPLYDAGVENLRPIKKIDGNTFYLGDVVRGSGLPTTNQRVVFWNTQPSGFVNPAQHPIIDPSLWPAFSGNSVAFSSVIYDSTLEKWIMLFNECDSERIQIYAAQSNNLLDWQPANNGQPILKVPDFEHCHWSGKNWNQTPVPSDIVYHDDKWYLFLDGYDKQGKRHIGLAVSSTNSLGPYAIQPQPILSPSNNENWDNQSCFHAKITPYKEGFMMFYDGRNSNGLEQVGMATSQNLIHWKKSTSNPVITEHSGWRSWIESSEPSYVETREDSIFLLVAGTKQFKLGAWHHYITERMYRDKSGNVGDAQLGIYLSTDGGKSFQAHANNPVMTNGYANRYENDHMGGCFEKIETDTADFIIYQAKSSFEGGKYNVLIREKKKSYNNGDSAMN